MELSYVAKPGSDGTRQEVFDQERDNNGLDQGEDRGNVVTGWI